MFVRHNAQRAGMRSIPALCAWYYVIMQYMGTRSIQGYTLVEMLVVVGIISMFAAIVFGGIQGSRENARDAKRQTDLKSLQLAIELYKEANGSYPVPDASCSVPADEWATPGSASDSEVHSCAVYVDGLTPVFIATLPTDPKSEDVDNLGIRYRSDGSNYKLMFYNTVENGEVAEGADFDRCADSCGETYCNEATYAVYSEGAACW